MNKYARMLEPLTLDAVRAESLRAHLKHGDNSLFNPAMSTALRLAALGEEYGEVCRELTYDHDGAPEKLVKELIQLANVALTWAETLDKSSNSDGKLQATMPMSVLSADDPLALSALEAYKMTCYARGDNECAEDTQRIIDHFRTWQNTNPNKVIHAKVYRVL